MENTRAQAYIRLLTLGCALLMSACGSGGGSGAAAAPPATIAQAPLPATSPFATVAATGDDWITFAHDYQRTGFQPQNTGITSANVASLVPRWKTLVNDEIYASPLVYNGNVIVVTLAGTVFDLSSKTGSILWQHYIGGEVRATPSIDNSTVFISNRLADAKGNPAPSWMFALHLVDGSLAWQTQIDGVTHGSPLVENGIVYVGTAGGDPETGCHDGGITALSETTGAQVWNWKVDPDPQGGGSSWGALASDGQHIYLGTGNTCQNPWSSANGLVALTKDGQLAWALSAVNDATLDMDDDTGSGVTLWYGRATFMSKNGNLYTVNLANGQQLWDTPLGAPDQQGGFATATTNGTTLFEGAGLIPASSAAAKKEHQAVENWRHHENGWYPGYVSYLRALDVNGRFLWSKQMQNWIISYAAVTNGLVFAGLDNNLTALDPTSGNTLWSYTGPNIFEAGPVIVPSGVYAADASGYVYAFALP